MTDTSKTAAPAAKATPKPGTPAPDNGTQHPHTNKTTGEGSQDPSFVPGASNIPPGSPVTAGTNTNDAGENGVKATEGNKSPSTVASNAPNSPNSPVEPAVSQTAARRDPAGGPITDPDMGEGAEDLTGESPMPTDEELDAIDAVEAKRDAENEGASDASHAKVVRLVAALPTTTPDSTTFGGYGGVVITYGDLRNIAARHRRSLDT